MGHCIDDARPSKFTFAAQAQAARTPLPDSDRYLSQGHNSSTGDKVGLCPHQRASGLDVRSFVHGSFGPLNAVRSRCPSSRRSKRRWKCRRSSTRIPTGRYASALFPVRVLASGCRSQMRCKCWLKASEQLQALIVAARHQRE